MSEGSAAEKSLLKSPPLTSEIDELLSAQLIVAWAGEKGGSDERRLGWWRTDLLSEFGGRDLLSQLLPRTGEWAVYQAVREAARRTDAAAREESHDSDLLLSLYSLGFEIDERADERFQELKQSGKTPLEAIPGLQSLVDAPWDQQAFIDWCEGHGKGEFTGISTGRRLKGEMPSSLDRIVQRLVAAMVPISDDYPLPHFRVGS